jgi:predicted dehydrogenase
MKRKTNRRDFLKESTLAGAGVWVASRSAWAQSNSPNERLNVASIGCGGMGNGDCNSVAGQGANIVALCDVDADRGEVVENRKKFPNAKFYTDFRKMFDEMGKEIDACTISTPDHTHAVATMMAMKHGKHVYTQKPLTHDVYEARMLTQEAAKGKVVTQMGNQGTSHDGLREAVEVVQSGAIGPVREVHVWTNRPVWPQGVGAILGLPGVKCVLHGDGEPTAKPRKGLDWDLWLGTAPKRPYQPGYMPFVWRGWWDYGTGALGDMACHTANMAFMACKLGYPTSVEPEMSEYNSETYPMWSVIRYEFPARENMPPLKWTWYDGGSDKPAWVNRKLKDLAHGRDIPGSGSLIIGDKGTLFSPDDYGSNYYLLPEKEFEGYKPPTPWLPRAGGNHYGEWVQACKENNPKGTMSNFGYAGPLTETVVLGCVAMRARKRIEWDGPEMRITNDEKANQYLKRDYRKGWEL